MARRAYLGLGNRLRSRVAGRANRRSSEDEAMSESIQRPGWIVTFLDSGNLDITVLPTTDNRVPITDVRPVSPRRLFLIRRRIASGAGDIPKTEATAAKGPT